MGLLNGNIRQYISYIPLLEEADWLIVRC